MVDDNNYYDIIEKMNEILSTCVKVKYSDGSVGSYLDLKDPDRYYLVFLIRELTFQQGTSLTTQANCSCGQTVTIELIRQNFLPYKIDKKLIEHFDSSTNSFVFELTNNKVFYMAPPTIGIQKSFTDYIVKEKMAKRNPNLSFLKIVPFLCVGQTTITQEELKLKLEEFQKIDNLSFQFLNSAVEKINFGIEKLTKYCQCGLEIHTDMVFPNGPSAIFVIHDAFDKFIKK
jgi:hypothetical protein